MHRIQISCSTDVSVGTGVSVDVVTGVCDGSSVDTPTVVAVAVRGVVLTSGMVNVEVTEATIGAESAPKATPAITKFATALAVNSATTIRRIVIRIQIFFSQCMDSLYSSGLGHCGRSQNSKIPFLV